MQRSFLARAGLRALISVLALIIAKNSSAELLGRDINGRAVAVDSAAAVFEYDADLDITWLRDWDYAHTSGFAPLPKLYMTWDAAMSWAETLNVGGFTGWRLPTAKSGCGSDGWLCTDTEMGHLYYTELGNGTGGLYYKWPFINADRSGYWLSTSADKDSAFVFSTSGGNQFVQGKYLVGGLAVVVRPGDVLAVPEIEGRVMLVLGVSVLATICRRRTAPLRG